MLMREDIDVNVADDAGRSPFHFAFEEEQVDVICLLIENGADLDLADEDGDNVDKTNKRGNTPLMCAAKSGHNEVAELLVANEANVDRTNLFGSTALLIAAKYRHREIVKQSIEHGAVVDVATNDGVTLLVLTAAADHVDVVRLLLESGTDITKTR
ncbi:TKL protein kinase [Phytophthora cinnamomi]|uniref:TKL protein kinase n=1 Tax=Phytophthora cinnamomi TaxID=4785 RepID=UPI0035595D46|nr:TKL protein kinase [Phytophthora cinnamomi]